MWVERRRKSFLVSLDSKSCSSVAKSCLTLCDPMDCSTPGFLVFHYLPEFAQTHVHWVGDAIQPSYPLLPPSSLTLSLSQHQAFFPVNQLFSWGGQGVGAPTSASVLPMNIQDWFLLRLTVLIFLQSKGLSRVFSNTTIWKHQFFHTQHPYGPTLTFVHDHWKNHSFD